ncbi:MAG TPA: LamG-like jellyroll fold domain-containing protein, partial [Ignavibacteriales bacterium]|nr:LamG-like jellyroll fold domain-containing protein [Ignavibacteriales bacterium]
VSGGTTLWSKSGTSLTAGNHYFTLTFSGTYYRIYVDGVLYIEQASTAKISTAGYIWLGSRNNSQISANTVIDDLAIFNRNLSENEIKRIYYSNQPLQESPGMTYMR